MINYSAKHLMFVIYDGINNSVFQSQVLQPLLNELEQNASLRITIVSFEKKRPSSLPPFFSEKKDRPDIQSRIDLIIFPRKPFFGKLSLIPAIKLLKSLLRKTCVDQVTARGPLAGYVALHALKNNSNKNISLLIQARGLSAQEYRYSKQKELSKSFLKSLWNKFIFRGLEKIEREVYGAKMPAPNLRTRLRRAGRGELVEPSPVGRRAEPNLKIEAVSPALKDYLIKEFGAEAAKITIATKDLPKSVDKCQIAAWRTRTREELGIPDDAIVYCYSGSFKPWQCAKETVEAFSFEYFKNPKSFLLILTQDIEPFKKELERFNISQANYIIVNVKPQELFRYLCAANFGFLLREPDIINWVSRPTKMLEYQACGLQIIHNNTVAWLAKK